MAFVFKTIAIRIWIFLKLEINFTMSLLCCQEGILIVAMAILSSRGKNQSLQPYYEDIFERTIAYCHQFDYKFFFRVREREISKVE